MEKKKVCDLKAYTIDLTKIDEVESLRITFTLNDAFFLALDQTEINKGNVIVNLSINKKSSTYELLFGLKGFVKIPCDRCLAIIDQPIDLKKEMYVKVGDKKEELNEDLIIVAFEERKLNVAWLMYEFISLSLPIMRSHLEGECDSNMLVLLAKHNVKTGEEAERAIDPRWNELKKILDNN